MIQEFKKTPKQIKATQLLAGIAKYIMLYGGSRSGKTFILIYAIIIRASKVKSRHCILRLKFNAVKKSIWLDTLPKVMLLCFPDLQCKWNSQDFYIKLSNGSEIWIGGLDNEKQMEKILGNEYSTLYFNESSQISYAGIEMGMTRLAEKNDLIKKAYFDENPPVKRHWSYQLFIRGINPKTGLAVKKERYASLLMNPEDNKENIDEGYFEILEGLSPDERARFEFGEFIDAADGQVYYTFDQELNVQECKQENGTVFVGLDFNVDPFCGVLVQFFDNKIYVFDEYFERNSDTPSACFNLIKRGYGGAHIIPDSTAKNRKTSGQSDLTMLRNEGFTVKPTRNPYVFDRVNNMNRLLSKGRIIISPKCKKLINDLEKVTWKGSDLDQKTDPLLTHISDALGYVAWWRYPIVDNAPFTMTTQGR